MNKSSTVGQRIVGSVIGLLAGGMLIGWLSYSLFYTPVPGGDPDQDLFGFMFYGGLGFLVGGTLGAVLGAFVVHPGPEPESSFERQGNDTHCRKCGSELIGRGGPCRKCDDVKTRPCSSCGRYVLANDKICPYCGADLK
ncbi:MAG TPA: zinc-ribbon domain-containing protein [Dehalococcoidia bacterium]|nr:zinc-ribbon domain-containing protein [Dehalococcoidia bacterium]